MKGDNQMQIKQLMMATSSHKKVNTHKQLYREDNDV